MSVSNEIMNSNKPADTKNSIPFVKIVGARMALMKNLKIDDTDTIRIVSILGKARMGKSTFLNAIISRVHATNVVPFQTQDDDEHCTRGMDAHYVKEQQLLLLDCQGLALEDSSHDPALLLFAYLISDTIIFNERMMLQNEALKLLEPICTFMAYINLEEIKKPKLYFRISDGDMVKNPQKNLEKVMTHYNDQYQSIRDSVAHLFQPVIGIVKTNTIDYAAKETLQTGNYLSLFSNARLGFAEAIDELLASLPAGQSASAWKHKIPTIIENINRNEKITIDKLDVVGQTAKLEIMEWINTVPPELFTPITVDGTQATYDANVVPRKVKKTKVLSYFNRIFKSIASAIKEPHYTALEARLSAPINEADVGSTEMAEEKLKAPLRELKNHPFPIISTFGRSLTNTEPLFFEDYMQPLRKVQAFCAPLFDPVKQSTLQTLKEANNAFVAKVREVMASEELETIAMTAHCDRIIDSFTEDMKARITALHVVEYGGRKQSMVCYEPVSLVDSLVKTVFTEVKEYLMMVPKYRTIQPKQEISTLNRSTPVTENYDLIKPVYTKFLNEIIALKTSAEFIEAIQNRKLALLYGQIVLANFPAPGIEFVSYTSDPLVSKFPFKMTRQTHDEIYMMTVSAVIDRLKAKQYIKDSDVDSLKGTNIGSHTNPTVQYLFEHTYRKIVAKRQATGVTVVEIFP